MFGSNKHMFLLAFLLTLGPVVWQFIVVYGVKSRQDAVCMRDSRHVHLRRELMSDQVKLLMQLGSRVLESITCCC